MKMHSKKINAPFLAKDSCVYKSMNVKLLILLISFTFASQTQEQLASRALTKLKQGEKELESKVRLNEDQCELASSYVLSDTKAQILRDGLANNVKKFGYEEAIQKFDSYADMWRVMKVDDAYKAFFNAFLDYYAARHKLSMAKKETPDDHLVIRKLMKDINKLKMAFLNKKEAYAAALVQDALKNSSSPKPRSKVN